MASELINTHSQQKTTGMNPSGVKSYFATFLEYVSESETRTTFFNVTPSVLSHHPCSWPQNPPLSCHQLRVLKASRGRWASFLEGVCVCVIPFSGIYTLRWDTTKLSNSQPARGDELWMCCWENRLKVAGARVWQIGGLPCNDTWIHKKWYSK